MDELEKKLTEQQLQIAQRIQALEAELQTQYVNLHRIAGGLAALAELRKIEQKA